MLVGGFLFPSFGRGGGFWRMIREGGVGREERVGGGKAEDL